MCVCVGEGVRKRGRKGGNMQVLNMDERKQRKQTCDTETVCEIGWGCTHMWSSPPHTHPSLCEAPLQPPVLRQQGCHGNVIQAMTLGISLTIRGRLNTPSSAAPWEEQWEQKKEGGGQRPQSAAERWRRAGSPQDHRVETFTVFMYGSCAVHSFSELLDVLAHSDHFLCRSKRRRLKALCCLPNDGGQIEAVCKNTRHMNHWAKCTKSIKWNSKNESRVYIVGSLAVFWTAVLPVEILRVSAIKNSERTKYVLYGFRSPGTLMKSGIKA